MNSAMPDLKSLFGRAAEIPSGPQRAAYLDQACGGNAGLRAEMDGLLQASDEAGSFMHLPAPTSVANGAKPAAEGPGTRIGPYKLLQQIGEGGMGIVYMAEQQLPVHRKVALKIIKPGMDSRQVTARFEAERQALAMMDHQNIAKVFDAGTTDSGRPYFVMELVHGLPITKYCDDHHLTPRERLNLFLPVCNAVQHAHQKGIIHRDLKPSNILVTMYDDKPVPKVIDFGVAKAVEQRLTEKTLFTQFGTLVGTFEYMSPEQAEMNAFGVDTRSDIYSLGVLLYELLTGSTPLERRRLGEAAYVDIVRLIKEEEPPRPSTRLSTSGAALAGISQQRGSPAKDLAKLVRGELDWIVMRCLEKDRTRRYETASSLARDVERYLRDEPVEACPPTTMYRFQKFARKHKPAIFTAAAIAACLILGTTVSAWQAVRATTAEAQASANEQRAVANEQKAVANAAVAQENAQQANQQRDEAQRQRDEVRVLNDKLKRTLYAAHMNLAQQAWEAGAIGRAEELLAKHRPKPGETDIRGFEWNYLYRSFHSELLTLNGLSGGGTPGGGVAISPDGKRLASGFADNTVKLFDANTGKELLTLKGHSNFVHSVTFSPDGKRLASGSGGWDATPKPGEVKIWDAQTGEELHSCKGHGGPVWKVAFSPDGRRLASASQDKTVKVWDTQTGHEILAITGPGRNDNYFVSGINSVAFSPDGKRLAMAGGGGVRLYNAETGEEAASIKYDVQAKNDPFAYDVTFSPDGKRLATAAGDETVRLWNADTGEELRTIKFPFSVRSVAFSPDGKRLATGDSERLVKVWDAETGEELFALKGHAGHQVGFVTFSPDGARLVSADSRGTVKIWNATPTKEARTFGGQSNSITSIAFSPDGKRLATGSRTPDPSTNAFVDIRDAETGHVLLTCKGLNASVWSVAYSPDGTRLASAVGDKTVRIWDAENGQQLHTLKGHTATVVSVAFSPDSRRVASSSSLPGSIYPIDPGEPGEVIVWDAQTGQRLFELKGHSRFVNSVTFSPDGKRLATASRDNTVRIWDSQNGTETRSLKTRGFGAAVVSFSPDGKQLAATSGGEPGGINDVGR